ncbi:nucleotide excision repair endonuclease [Cytobacillus massiliigabonensis]|uniref:nucleotide excision repair endonuclease n=1 Tax=Cytobacillus massiliigabonensis TaxID=1871011 RepID=UPI000C85430F|nr:nucleotide excision repair endonuclease [Cytobacillus massiliigabonensis]
MDLTIYPRDALKVIFPLLGKSNMSGIYFIFGEDGELIYIGKAKCLYSRLRSHFHSYWDNIWDYEKELYYFSYIVLEAYSLLKNVEKNLIIKYQPKLNGTYNKNTFRIDDLQRKKDKYFESVARSRGFKDAQEMVDHAMNDFFL